MSTQSALITVALVLGGALAWKQYEAAKEKERAAKQWNTVISGATALVGLL